MAEGPELHHRRPNGDPNISAPTNVTRQPGLPAEVAQEASDHAGNEFIRKAMEMRQQQVVDNSFLHGGTRALDGIALHAFCLGIALSASLLLCAYLALYGYQIWRLPQFIATLATFHFLEFYTTARWIATTAKVSSFLLFSNGTAYNIAHSCAMTEIVVTSLLAPNWQARFSAWYSMLFAALLIVIGQSVRSIAMAQAGTNFNHIPVKERVEGHKLVTWGVYKHFRHPSYFGFFWWAIGTQLFVGNVFCTFAYTVVLWRFFNARIKGEEKSLMQFFGKDYEDYKARTYTRIPFIR
ncbi:protein-S-isoprenylcysteine O-methyltransferase [Elsinoe australis]|uniref:Protein-S-isoprenylcysteine O-methyltransferase n=1 Tax=Elsinoe australis TaxID=40998 RepID=A0A4U7AW83_9PEZI|nr:protein-S-isoprenylcysteine O-methyltransferase [Elsinoe australis]